MRRRPNAANYRQLADAYVASGEFSKASEAFRQAANRYRHMGDPNAAKVLEMSADRYKTTIGVYFDRNVPPVLSFVRAKFEPVNGCYLGANIEREEETQDPATFNERVGRHHAIFFMYRRYGVAFPTEYARTLRRAGCALQLSWEPNNLADVNDDEYLRRFAEDARRSNIPIFLRYACEMNGDWTPYHSDPREYVRKFILVAGVMHRYAPNVAMVWCPNEIPEEPISKYYPGADAVDWVGVNFYSVIYNDADIRRPAEWRHPEDALNYIYRTYAGRHPIMVGEWAATHRSAVDNRERPDFAATKIAQFYSSIPLLYPRVKAVNWLSFNAFKYAERGRQLNDYSLFDNRSVAAAYSLSIADPYYLPQVDPDANAPRPTLLPDGIRLHPNDSLSAYIRTYESRPTVTVMLDSWVVTKTHQAGSVSFRIPDGMSAGMKTLKIEVHDSRGKLAGIRKIPIFIS